MICTQPQPSTELFPSLPVSTETDALGTRLDMYDPHLPFKIHPTMIRITDTNDTALKEKKIFICETITHLTEQRSTNR